MTQLDPAPAAVGTAGGRDAPAAAAGDDDAGRSGPAPWWRRPWVLGLVLVAVLAVPLAMAVGVLHSPRWYPILDLAQTELKVRDVGTRHSPLVGLAGRIEAYGQRGSHPGPLSFWALRPVYTLLGDQAWGLQVSTALIHLAAMATALWIGYRRGGTRLLLGMAAVVAVVAHMYGATTLTEAWNPYLPVMWWLVFVLAVWSVACDDLVMLPVAVFAGSWCLQTHVSYLGLVSGLSAAVVVTLAVFAWRRRDDRAGRRRLAGWVALALGLGAVLWSLPVLDQLRHDPGNLSIVVQNFRHPSDAPIGASRGLGVLGSHLDLWRLARGNVLLAGSGVLGWALVAVWLVSAVVAWRARARADLLKLHGTLGVVLVLSAVSASRIFGTVWYYLSLWAWGTAALLALAVVWTAVSVGGPQVRRAAPVAAVAVLVTWTVLFTVAAARVQDPAPAQSRMLGALAPSTVAALDAPGAPGGGRAGRYRVTWTDPISLGGPGEGLLLELERHGFDARAASYEEEALGAHRIIAPGDATGEVHLSFGPDIEAWRRAHPEAREVAHADLRTPAQRARYARLKAEAVAGLTAAGQDPTDLEDRLSLVGFDAKTPTAVKRLINEMATLGQPAAVFVSDRVSPTPA